MHRRGAFRTCPCPLCDSFPVCGTGEFCLQWGGVHWLHHRAVASLWVRNWGQAGPQNAPVLPHFPSSRRVLGLQSPLWSAAWEIGLLPTQGSVMPNLVTQFSPSPSHGSCNMNKPLCSSADTSLLCIGQVYIILYLCACCPGFWLIETLITCPSTCGLFLDFVKVKRESS